MPVYHIATQDHFELHEAASLEDAVRLATQSMGAPAISARLATREEIDVCTMRAKDVQPLHAPVACDHAEEIVKCFVAYPFNDRRCTWEKMITNPSITPHGCLIDALDIRCPANRLSEVAFYAQQALNDVFPQFKWSAAAWNRHRWSDDEIREVIAIVAKSIHSTLSKPSTELSPEVDAALEVDSTADVSGFVPWQLLRIRKDVPGSKGVYVLADFENGRPTCIDLLGENLLYVGITDKRTLATRLDEFVKSALGGFGHSAGWTFRMEYCRDWQKLRTFHQVYVSWCSLGTDQSARDLECRLLSQFEAKWKKLPVLNRQR